MTLGGILCAWRPKGSAGSGWTPASLPGLALWLETKGGTFWQDEARTTPATADGATVKAWDDQSGQGNHVTHATGATLKTGIAGVGGESVIRANGTTQALARTFSGVLTAPITVLTVYDQGRPLDKSGGGNRLLLNPTPGTFGMWGGVALEGAESHVAGTFRLQVAVFDGTTSRFYVDDGTSPVEGDAGSNDCSGVTMFSDGGTFFAGDCAALLLVDGELTDDQINRAARYLASRYGLTWTDIPTVAPVTTGPLFTSHGYWAPEV